MERKITQDIKRKVAKMRRKYFGDIASEEYIRTGMPSIVTEKLEKLDDDIKRLTRENRKNTKEVIANAKKGRKGKKEYNTIFI